jgi:hypothetical protein
VPVAVFETRHSRVERAELCARRAFDSERHPSQEDFRVCASTHELFNIEEAAMTDLKDRMARQVTKAILSAATKVGVAAGVGKATESDAVGLLAALVLFSASQADTRSWLLLPGSLQAARLDLRPGLYDLSIEMWSASRRLREESLGQVELRSRDLMSFQWRAWE